MSILLFAAFGLLIGLVARAIMPGRQSMGLVMTALLGMAGSVAGGAIVSILSGHSILEFHTSGILGSMLGAIAVLAVLGFVGRGHATV